MQARIAADMRVPRVPAAHTRFSLLTCRILLHDEPRAVRASTYFFLQTLRLHEEYICLTILDDLLINHQGTHYIT